MVLTDDQIVETLQDCLSQDMCQFCDYTNDGIERVEVCTELIEATIKCIKRLQNEVRELSDYTCRMYVLEHEKRVK